IDNSLHLLVLVIHHIVSDGWSMGVLGRELGMFYDARENELPPMPMQYADYTLWQREQLQGTVLEKQLAYWRRQLDGLIPPELPSDRPRPAVQSYRGSRCPMKLSPALTAALKSICRQEQATLYMLLLAAFQVLLARHSGQMDVAVGTPLAGRDRFDLEGLIGFFVNTLVIRTDLGGNPSFRELLARVRETVLDAHAHQCIPFEKIVEELNPGRDPGKNPFTQIIFGLLSPLDNPLSLTGLTGTNQPIENGTAKFDLNLLLFEEPDGAVHGSIEYPSDLFETSTILCLTSHFTTLLEGLVSGSVEMPISLLPILTEQERHRILEEWNRTGADYPRNLCFQQLFEEQAVKSPDAIAVIEGSIRISYSELNTRANRLAYHLRSLGVGRDTLVGICIPRSVDMVVAMLAVFKSGGAYVPIDPDYPADRIAFMLKDSCAPVLLTRQNLFGLFPDYPGLIFCMDRDWTAISAMPEVNPDLAAGPENLCYVIYTSGSTGRPKGVMIEHRSLINFVFWLQNEFRLSANERMLQSSVSSFDISIFELWWPLSAGASLVLMPVNDLQLPSRLFSCARENQVNVMMVVPSLLSVLLDEGSFSNLHSLRLFFSAGEALDPQLARRFRKQSGAELINAYGPTETTVSSACWRYPPDRECPEVPIGRPLANTRLYVLDPYLQPVPAGVPGELYIGGEGLARGYWQRPELTSERFLQDTFMPESMNARMYRTGDRVKYMKDGNLLFLGRFDNQVKLRGFRIELGEIETILLEQPNIRQAVVLLREDNPGDPRLVAYVIPDSKNFDSNQLRRALRLLLPEYMVPSAFVQLSAFPLLPNGKVDRKTLPRPEYENREKTFRAPTTALEKIIRDMWLEVLHLDNAGVDDNFFDAGGHSLLAVQLINRINREFDLGMTIRNLFETPTIEGLALTVLALFDAENPPETKSADFRP
ncbi:MAG: amino acid adenylation domain-containing protein, partial [Chlorobiaceae bacterium]|nr:amino acid adenylation domain-containing protein [Chlorobiaceae bacterium]